MVRTVERLISHGKEKSALVQLEEPSPDIPAEEVIRVDRQARARLVQLLPHRGAISGQQRLTAAFEHRHSGDEALFVALPDVVRREDSHVVADGLCT